MLGSTESNTALAEAHRPARPGDQPSGRGKPAPAKGKAQPTRSRPAKKVGWAVAKPKKNARPKKKK